MRNLVYFLLLVFVSCSTIRKTKTSEHLVIDSTTHETLDSFQVTKEDSGSVETTSEEEESETVITFQPEGSGNDSSAYTVVKIPGGISIKTKAPIAKIANIQKKTVDKVDSSWHNKTDSGAVNKTIDQNYHKTLDSKNRDVAKKKSPLFLILIIMISLGLFLLLLYLKRKKKKPL